MRYTIQLRDRGQDAPRTNGQLYYTPEAADDGDVARRPARRREGVMIDTRELKRIADGLAAIGKPPDTNRRTAMLRLALMERFERLVRNATPTERHELVTTLRDMLADCQG